MDEKGQIICDTDVIIDWTDDKLRRHQATKHILLVEIGVRNIEISCITKMELIQGAKSKQELQQLNKKIAAIGLIPMNEEISHLTISIFEKFSLSHGLSIPDGIIAATAIHLDIQLFTYNTKDYRMIPGLKLYKPTQAP